MEEKILGNFLNQPNKDFPLDAECLAQMQTNAQMLETLGNIAGDKVVLAGCSLRAAGTERSAGYVFLKTADYPNGEVIYFSGGSITGMVHIEKQDVSISAQGNNYPKAYTKRWLAPGYGSENYNGNEIVDVVTLVSQIAQLKALSKRVDDLVGEPLGIIKMYAGSNVPNGYLLCDGKDYRIDDYPELYAAIGATYNSAPDSSGNNYTTDTDRFRVPDLRGRFVVGKNVNDNDYINNGKVGGEKKHSLTAEELAEHVHIYSGDSNFCENNYQIPSLDSKLAIAESDSRYASKVIASNGSASSHGQGTGCVYYSGKTGKNVAHENRPPYYTLSYIIKAI